MEIQIGDGLTVEQKFKWQVNRPDGDPLPVPLHDSDIGCTINTVEPPYETVYEGHELSSIVDADNGEFSLSINSSIFGNRDKLSLLVWAYIPHSGFNWICKRILRKVIAHDDTNLVSGTTTT